MEDVYVSFAYLVTITVRLHFGTNIVYLEQDLLFQDCDQGLPDNTYDLP
jgi:hypothetical protein